MPSLLLIISTERFATLPPRAVPQTERCHFSSQGLQTVFQECQPRVSFRGTSHTVPSLLLLLLWHCYRLYSATVLRYPAATVLIHRCHVFPAPATLTTLFSWHSKILGQCQASSGTVEYPCSASSSLAAPLPLPHPLLSQCQTTVPKECHSEN